MSILIILYLSSCSLIFLFILSCLIFQKRNLNSFYIKENEMFLEERKSQKYTLFNYIDIFVLYLPFSFVPISNLVLLKEVLDICSETNRMIEIDRKKIILIKQSFFSTKIKKWNIPVFFKKDFESLCKNMDIIYEKGLESKIEKKELYEIFERLIEDSKRIFNLEHLSEKENDVFLNLIKKSNIKVIEILENEDFVINIPPEMSIKLKEMQLNIEEALDSDFSSHYLKFKLKDLSLQIDIFKSNKHLSRDLEIKFLNLKTSFELLFKTFEENKQKIDHIEFRKIMSKY